MLLGPPFFDLLILSKPRHSTSNHCNAYTNPDPIRPWFIKLFHSLTISVFPRIRGALIESSDGPVWMYGTAFEHSGLFDYQFAHAKNVYAGHIQHETAYYQGNPDAVVPFTPQTAFTDPPFTDCAANVTNCVRTWGLRLVNASSVFIYGIGLYNFFDNWDTAACLPTESCQEHMVDVENCTDVYLWALSTKGSQYLVSYQGQDVVPYGVNQANFCDTIALFEVAETE